MTLLQNHLIKKSLHVRFRFEVYRIVLNHVETHHLKICLPGGWTLAQSAANPYQLWSGQTELF